MDAARVVDQMLDAGLAQPPQPLNLQGKVQRFGPKKNDWYSLRMIRTDAGTDVVVGSFGSWKLGFTQKVEVDWAGIGEQEREALTAQRQAAATAAQAERAELARLAALGAGELWRSARPAGRSPYLERKGFAAGAGEACRYLADGSIVIPLIRYDLPREQALRGLQRIFADGAKRFTRGFDKPGACTRLGLVVQGEPIIVCEGFATGLTLRLALERRLPVFVALDAGNLLPVCERLRELHPRLPILIAADDDWQTVDVDGRPINPGRQKAHKASQAVSHCSHTLPVFHPARRGRKHTDFDDLRQVEEATKPGSGLAVVARQLTAALRYLRGEHHLAPTAQAA